MRLLSLTANKDSFRPVYFNKSGLTLVVGRQKTPETSDSGRTYNGVGKSLIVNLVHFCLGAGTNSKIEDAIPGWEFSLRFEVNGEEHTSTRSVLTQNKISLNDEELSTAKFCARLEQMVFTLPSRVKGLTFRSLLNRFVRPHKGSYVSFDKVHDKESEYHKLLCQSFLLGLDIDLVMAKQALKAERDRIKEFRNNLNQDSVFREFFTEGKNIEIELQDLEDKINQLTRDLEAFRVADNYHDIQKEAQHTKNLLQEAKNREVVLANAINSINASLEVRPDISPEKLLRLYSEARAKLPDSVIKEINEVNEFHNKLLANRVRRLTAEKSRLERELKSIREDITTFSRKRDSQLRFLGTHGAFNDMVSVNHQLSDLRANAQKIRDYQDLLQRYSDEAQEITIQLSNETKRANTYLKQAKPVVDENFNRFRAFSKRFYHDKPGGLTVSNNEGDNQIRFNIEAHIQDDASDGINEVKIFCFDMTLLMAGHNHNCEFLFHDSRLFSDMDPRQRATLFKIAYECTKQNKTQYIATLNANQILSMKDQFTDEEFRQIFDDNIVLELTDEGASGKLLGIQVDMQYE
jgi:uncharacterized protein YydD (DUF2326 family)